MNDRYLSRAKRTDNGEWVEGNLVRSDDAQLDAETKCNYQWGEWLQSEVEVDNFD